MLFCTSIVLKSMGKKEFRWTDEEAELLLTVAHQYKVCCIRVSGNLTVQSTDTIKLLYSESEVFDFLKYKEKVIEVVQGNHIPKKNHKEQR